MLINLENTSSNNIDKLIKFAEEQGMKLSFIDDSDKTWLPGKPLSEEELEHLIENSRKSGMISMENAHKMIRSSKHAD